MGWDEVTAIGSVGAALVLVVASVAAVIQLKHLRLANQIGSYLELMQQLNSPEMVDARAYIESCDFDDPETLQAALAGGLDRRVMMYGGFYQIVARLINHRILDRDLFAPFYMTAPRVWRTLRPVAYEMRARDPGNPRWMDLEYLVYSCKVTPINLKRYSAGFREEVALDRQLTEWSKQAREAAHYIGRLSRATP